MTHRIRLREPWQADPTTRSWRRRFGWPTMLAEGERLWLSVTMPCTCEVRLNGVRLGSAPLECDISDAVQARNELALDCDEPIGATMPGTIALEVRASPAK